MEDLAASLARFIAHRRPDWGSPQVRDLIRIHGGASRETYRLRLSWDEDGQARQRALILRRDPTDSLIETERKSEFYAYRAFHGSAVPVPEPLWLEEDPVWLERPFFVMEQVENCEAAPQALMLPPFSNQAVKIGRRKWEILGEIAKADPKALGLVGILPAPEPGGCFVRELDHWEQILDEDEQEPQPIARAAIRWLRRNPPPPPERLAMVHGDYRTGNFLVDEEGAIQAILDWEMCHLGDPLEDLAWSLNRIWHWARDERSGGLLPREEAIEAWERGSGLCADPEALRRWEIFASVKALGIWLSAGKAYQKGPNRDPVLAFTAWWLPNAQNRAALESLGRL